MATQYLTLTLRGSNPELLGTQGYVQVDDGPRVLISPEELGGIFQMAEELAGTDLVLMPVPGTNGEEESVRVPLLYPLNTFLPKACFAIPTPEGLQTIPGQIGALCLTVGGADVLATMMGVATSDILTWAKDGLPVGPARILLVRLGRDFGLNFRRIPTANLITAASSRELA